jgi:hypothetical protein
LGVVPFFVLRSDLVLAEGYRDAFSGLASICGASLDGYARLLRRGESAGPLWLQEAYETAIRIMNSLLGVRPEARIIRRSWASRSNSSWRWRASSRSIQSCITSS